MDFFDVINTRKTIRKYKEDHPPIEDIKRIIDAGRLAPSATNSQNWKFIAIYNDEIKQQMLKALKDKYDNILSWEESKGYENKVLASKNYALFFAQAPVIIVAIETPKQSYTKEIYKAKKFSEEEINAIWSDSSILSMGAALENMSLTAHALGYGTCWMCAPIAGAQEFKKILKINDEDRIVSLLTVGIPENKDTKSPQKKILEDIMKIIK